MSPAPAVPAPTGKVGLAKWLSGHKWEAGLGGAGIAVTVYLAYRSRQNAAASSSGTTTSSTGASAALPSSYYPAGSGGGGEGGGGGNFGNEIGDLVTELQSEITAANGASSGSSTPAPAAAPSYSALANSSDLQALTSTSTPLFYQAGGQYEQVGDQPGNTTDPELAWIQQNLPGGTGLYVKSQ